MKQSMITVCGVLLLVCALTNTGMISSAVACDSAIAGDNSAAADDGLLNEADRAAVDLSVTRDALAGSSVLLEEDDRGSCEAPKLTGGCLKCADKAACKSCCTDHFGPDASGGSDKKRAGCQKGCDSKWTSSSSCSTAS